MEFSILELTCIAWSILEGECALPMIEVVQKFTIICYLVSYEPTLGSLSFFVGSFKRYALAPFFAFSMQYTILKLSIYALMLSDNSPQSIRHIILIKSEIVKAVCIVLAVTFSFGVA